jgi:hypothetical protein
VTEREGAIERLRPELERLLGMVCYLEAEVESMQRAVCAAAHYRAARAVAPDTLHELVAYGELELALDELLVLLEASRATP